VLTRELRAILWLFAALAFAAGILLYVLSGNTDDTFSWSIQPPLTAAFLGAGYWAALVLFVWSASRREWDRARAALLPAFVIAVLLLVATLVHFDRFHRDLFGWFWLSAYIAVPPLLLAAAARQLRAARGAPAPRGRALPAGLRLVLVVQALALTGVGVALFVSPGSAGSLWPWTLTPLTARAVGAFCVGFGAAAAQAVWENDVPRLAGSALAYAALGALELVALARYPGELDGSGARGAVYVAFAATVLVTGVWGSALARRAAVQGG